LIFIDFESSYLAHHFAQIQEFEKAERCYLKAQCPGECVEMYNRAAKWEHAFRKLLFHSKIFCFKFVLGLAKQYMNKDDVTKLYSNQAKELEAKGRYKEAEKLYITINDNAAAILMYKRTKNYDALIRLVRQYYPDKLKDTEITIAKELEQEKRYKEAEMHYVQAGDWKSAANMYRLLDNWDDAYRNYEYFLLRLKRKSLFDFFKVLHGNMEDRFLLNKSRSFGRRN
jgi:intraflagellar transport protein 172